MKVLGHPLHVMIIHFPSALFPMDLVCSIAGYGGVSPIFLHAAFFASVGGVVLGWIAIITGIADMVPIVKKKPTSVTKALSHGAANTSVVIGFTVLAMITYKNYPDLEPDRVAILGVKTALVLILFFGNFLGGSLILKDKVLDQ